MYIGVQSCVNPDIGFVINVYDNFSKAKKLISHGFECWICHSAVDFPTTYFDKDDEEWIYYAGYSEPATYLLDKYGISHGEAEACFDECGDLLCEWKNVDIDWVY